MKAAALVLFFLFLIGPTGRAGPGELGLARVRFLSVSDESPIQRIVYYQVSVPAPKGEGVFHVLPPGQDTPIPLKVLSGSLNWVDQVAFDYYSPEAPLERTYKIYQGQGRQKVFHLTLLIDPWDLGRRLGRDLREVGEGYREFLSKRPKMYSEIFIPSYSYETIGLSYQVDDHLGLAIKKKILLNARIQVIRPSSLAQGSQAKESLRDGAYLLRAAFYKKYRSFGAHTPAKTYVDFTKKIVNINGGMLITPVEFTLRDLSLKRARASIVLQIQPLDPEKLKAVMPMGMVEPQRAFRNVPKFLKGRPVDLESLVLKTQLKSSPFVGPIRLISPHFSSSMRKVESIPYDAYYKKGLAPTETSDDLVGPSMKDLEKIGAQIQQQGRRQAFAQASLLPRYARQLNLHWEEGDRFLHFLNFEDGQSDITPPRRLPRLTWEGLEEALEQERGEGMSSLSVRLCYYRFYGPMEQTVSNSQRLNHYLRCKREAQEDFFGAFEVQRHLKVHKVGQDKTRYLGGSYLNVNLGTSFSLQSSKRLIYGVQGATDPGKAFWGALKGGPFADVATGLLSVNISAGASFYHGLGRGLQVGSGTYLVVQKATFELFFEEYWPCVSIIFKDHGPEDSRGVLSCSSKMERGHAPVKEDFFYFAQHFTAGDMLDPHDLKNHPWLLLLRGERDFLQFVEGISPVDVKTTGESFEGEDDPNWLEEVLLKIVSLRFDDRDALLEDAPLNRPLGKWPIDKLTETYQRAMPGLPGLYNFPLED